MDSHRTKIPILDLSKEIETHWNPLNEAIQKVLRSGHFILGENIRLFEEEIASYLGVKHAVTLNSGTDALVIGLRALGIKPGDEVLTSPFSFFATAEAISQVGAIPVYVDIDERTFNLSPTLIEEKITAKTRAIIPVHLFGLATEMDPLLSIAQKYDLLVLEDVAQACGGRYRDRYLGSLGNAGAFSFFPTKNLGAYGDGGMLTTNEDKVADTARRLRVHGSSRRYHHEALGYTSRLDEMQAAILRVKLPHLNKMNEARAKAASRYDEVLKGRKGIKIPTSAPNATHVYHQYTIRVENGLRDAVHQDLATQGIATMIYYPIPIHRLEVYQPCTVSLPRAEKAASEVLSLPIWPEITPDIQLRVCDALLEVTKGTAYLS